MSHPNTTHRRLAAICLAGLPALLLVMAVQRPTSGAGQRAYRSPFDLAFAPVGRALAVTDRTASEVALIDTVTGVVRGRAPLSEPTGLAWSADGRALYVAEYGADSIAELRAGSLGVVRRLPTASRPIGVAIAQKSRQLLAACTSAHALSIIDLATGRERRRIQLPGEPFSVTLTPDQGTALVTILCPIRPALDPENSSSVVLVSVASGRVLKEIRLPAGSTCVRGAAISRDGRWAYVAHALGRFNLPTTQLDRGWVNTNAFTILDLRDRKPYATLLLDHPSEGAADPWGVALAPDGSALWVSLSGVHMTARIDLQKLHQYLAKGVPDDHPLARTSSEYGATARSTWVEIKTDPSKRADLVNDLSALYVADLIEKLPSGGKGPRGIAVSPDGSIVATANFFAGSVGLRPSRTDRPLRVASLGSSPRIDLVRQGEINFHDGTLCFQHWLSCATCHPDVRTDGLNWDLLNDGIGNPKNTHSMLLAHRRAPLMSHGIRASMEVATVAGFRFIEFREPQPGEAEAIQAFIRTLKPLPSPYLTAGGRLNASARRGDTLFHSSRVGCSGCHTGSLHTNLKIMDVGTRNEFDSGASFVTPTLVEVWRTAPYLHDGRAVTLEEVISRFNRGDRHGVTAHLSKAQVHDLAEYVRSL